MMLLPIQVFYVDDSIPLQICYDDAITLVNLLVY